MNILYLKYAVEVARIGSINKASEELFVAQPNLSRAIKELEKELGITVFDRNSKGMTLTPDGERLVSYGRKILREIDEVEEMFKTGESRKSTLTVSVPRASYISYAFAKFTEKLLKEEQCDIFYKETNALRAINNILRGDYKLGVIRYASVYDKQFKEMLEAKKLNYELVTEFKYRLLTNKKSPLAELDEVKFSDLEYYIEIAHADPYVPSLPMSDVRKEELPDNIKRRIFVFERASQFDMMAENPELFMWVSPVPDETLERYNLTMLKCNENIRYYRDVLIYPEDYRLTELDKAFISCLCDAKRKFIG